MYYYYIRIIAGFLRLQDVEGISLTPFEKNLEFWKQLWRVIERRFVKIWYSNFNTKCLSSFFNSDVIVQIVDARNPLLFRCEDLEAYVKEVDKNKINLILINKSDLLNEKQRLEWLRYFEKMNCKVVFWSAFYAAEANAAEAKEATKEERKIIKQNKEINNNKIVDDVIEEANENNELENKFESRCSQSTQEECEKDEDDDEEFEEEELISAVANLKNDNLEESNTSKIEEDSSKLEPELEKCKILTRKELITLFKTIHKDLEKMKPGSTTIGMVG